jgi:hypothetical protein
MALGQVSASAGRLTPRGAIRAAAMSSLRATLDPRERPAPAEHPVMR